MFSGPVDQVPTLGRGGARYATGIDDHQLRLLRQTDLGQPKGFQKLANLLTLIAIYFAAESQDGEFVQHVI